MVSVLEHTEAILQVYDACNGVFRFGFLYLRKMITASKGKRKSHLLST